MRTDLSQQQSGEAYHSLILDVLLRVETAKSNRVLSSLLFLAGEQYARFAAKECGEQVEKAVFEKSADILARCAQRDGVAPATQALLVDAFTTLSGRSVSGVGVPRSTAAVAEAIEKLSLADAELRQERLAPVSSSQAWCEQGDAPATPGLRILVVEDDLVSRLALSRIVANVGSVDVAPDGHEGFLAYLLAASEGAPYDVIFLDVLLPRLHGMQLLKHIRSLEESRGITLSGSVPIVMATGESDPATTLGSFREGCEAYLVKPIHRKDVFKVLDKLSLTATTPSEEVAK